MYWPGGGGALRADAMPASAYMSLGRNSESTIPDNTGRVVKGRRIDVAEIS